MTPQTIIAHKPHFYRRRRLLLGFTRLHQSCFSFQIFGLFALHIWHEKTKNTLWLRHIKEIIGLRPSDSDQLKRLFPLSWGHINLSAIFLCPIISACVNRTYLFWFNNVLIPEALACLNIVSLLRYLGLCSGIPEDSVCQQFLSCRHGKNSKR